MKVIGLISGGKDSCYNLIKCIQNGHKIVALLNLIPQVKDQGKRMFFFFYLTHLFNLISNQLFIFR